MTTELCDINLNYLIKIVHYIVSGTFLIVALALTIRSVWAIKNKVNYSRTDKYLAFAFLINLYLQLILGLLLFTNLGVGSDYHYLENSNSEMIAKRLWPIEHIVLMVFALFIANLGFISSLQTRDSIKRHKKILIYYLIALALIAYSLFAIYV